VRGLDVLQAAAAGTRPSVTGLPVRRLSGAVPTDATALWEAAWDSRMGLRPEQWFDSARLAVPHVGDAQRRPIEKLGFDAVSAVIEPLAVYSTDASAPAGAGLAISVLSPDGFELRAIGVRGSAATA